MPFRRGIKRRRAQRGRTARRPRFVFGRKKRTSSGKGITQQHDTRMIYRKKFMPGRKKRRWRKFTKKIHAVSEKSLGAQTVVFNKTFQISNSTANNHAVGSISLYSNQSTSSTAHNDLKVIYDRHKQNPAVVNMQNISDRGIGTYLNDTAKFLFQSAVLDITFRNTSGNGTDLNSELTLEVDVYEMSWGTKGMEGIAPIGSLHEALVLGNNTTSSIGQGGNSITTLQRGVTPFEMPQALSTFKIKILKKTKYFLPNNGQFTYQLRDPGRHVITSERINDNHGCNIPGLTKWIYVVAKTLPGIVVDATKQEILKIGVTRKYMYKIRGENSRRDYWDNL